MTPKDLEAKKRDDTADGEPRELTHAEVELRNAVLAEMKARVGPDSAFPVVLALLADIARIHLEMDRARFMLWAGDTWDICALSEKEAEGSA